MLNQHIQQAPQFNSIFSTYELQEILLQGTDARSIDFELDELIELSDEPIEIDEIQISKLYLCL